MMKNLTCSLLLIGLFFSTYVLAQPELDTTFASSGRMIVQMSANGSPTDTVVQPDNKILMLGTCGSVNFGGRPICLVRLNEDGSPDTTFTNNASAYAWYVITNIPNSYNYGAAGTSIALQNDGKIVVAGYATFSASERMFVVRYNSNGSLDSTFGTNGIITTSVEPYTRANDLLVQPDGKIVAVGYTRPNDYNPNYRQFAVRYLPNGTLDNSFGSGGIVIVSIAGNYSSASAAALQADGRILIGGSTWTAPNSTTSAASYLLTRLNADGSLDTAFDADGLKSIAFGTGVIPDWGFISTAIQSDQRIVALGHNNILYCFNADGSLDRSFDGDGSRPALNGISDVFDLMVTPSGRITVVGYPTPYSSVIPLYYRTARYLPNGAPDASYSGDGYLDVDVSNVDDGALAVASDSTGRIVIAGQSAQGTAAFPWQYAQFSIARLLAAPVQNVGLSGRITQPNGRPIANAAVTLKRGTENVGYGRTNYLGYFRVPNVGSGQTYTLSVSSKYSTFTDRRVLVDNEITNFSIVGGQ